MIIINKSVESDNPDFGYYVDFWCEMRGEYERSIDSVHIDTVLGTVSTMDVECRTIWTGDVGVTYQTEEILL